VKRSKIYHITISNSQAYTFHISGTTRRHKRNTY